MFANEQQFAEALASPPLTGDDATKLADLRGAFRGTAAVLFGLQPSYLRDAALDALFHAWLVAQAAVLVKPTATAIPPPTTVPVP